MMATAISGLSRTIVWTRSRSFKVGGGSSSSGAPALSTVAVWSGDPGREGASGASGDDEAGGVVAADLGIVLRSIHRAHRAKMPSPTALPHWLISEVIVSTVDV